MITNPSILESFERDIQKGSDLSLEKKFALLDGMYLLARSFGHFTHERVSEGLDEDLRFVSVLHNRVRKSPH
jgi:hypothetical protein